MLNPNPHPTMKTCTIGILSFLFGFATFAALFVYGWVPSSTPQTVEQHYALIREARRQADHPPEEGEWVDPDPSLAWLSSRGEIEEVDLVLPEVKDTKKAMEYLLAWVNKHSLNKHPDVLWMWANPTYTYYNPSGEQPFHFQLWFHEEARPKVQQLIKDLEAM